MSAEESEERPRSSGLLADEFVKSQKQMEELQGEALKEAGTSSKKVMRFSSWNVINAIEQGYVKPGLRLLDYLRATWEGYEDDPPSPVCKCGIYIGQSEGRWKRHRDSTEDGYNARKHGRRPIKRFELVNVWGIQGAKKSTFIAQLILALHGAYDPTLSDEEFHKICDYCQKITITNTKELIEVGRELKEAGDSYDVLYLDDLNSIIPKQLAWKDREAYEAVFEAIGMIRRNVRVIITSTPNIEMVMAAFNRVMTFEVIVYPASKYKVERMCHDIHPYFWAKDKVTKIVIEEGRFNPYDTPHYFWATYEKRTNSEGNRNWQRSLDKLQAYEEGGGKTAEEVTRKAIHAVKVPTREISNAYREAGGTISEREVEKLLKIAKAKMVERASEKESTL
jgi:hypothetical protein